MNAADMLMIMHNLCARVRVKWAKWDASLWGRIFYACCQWTVNWRTFTPYVAAGPGVFSYCRIRIYLLITTGQWAY